MDIGKARRDYGKWRRKRGREAVGLAVGWNRSGWTPPWVGSGKLSERE